MKNPLLHTRTSDIHIFRGGFWRNFAWFTRASIRDSIDASYRDYSQSFRLFRTQEKS